MDEPKDPKLSRKEFAKQMRRAAYERAKEFRATDPKQVAFKEAMKQRRRDANDVAKDRQKEQRKEATRVQKAKAREDRGSRAATTPDATARDDHNDRIVTVRGNSGRPTSSVNTRSASSPSSGHAPTGTRATSRGACRLMCEAGKVKLDRMSY